VGQVRFEQISKPVFGFNSVAEVILVEEKGTEKKKKKKKRTGA